MNACSHLDPAIAEVMSQGKEARIARLKCIPYIPTWASIKVLEWLSFLRRMEAGNPRPRCLQIVGPSNVGKSAVLDQYFRQCSTSSRNPDGYHARPVVLVEAPYDSAPRHLSDRIISACLGNPVMHSRGEPPDQVEHVLRSSGVEQLLIDELGNLTLRGRLRSQQDLGLLRRLCNLGITLGVATTKNLQMVMTADEQLASRFQPVFLPRWSESEELRSFLGALEAYLPLPEPSFLDRAEIVRWLISRNCACTGDILNIVRDAAMRAILEDAPCLTVDLFQRVADSSSPPDGRTFGR
jgi:hypothetical protein